MTGRPGAGRDQNGQSGSYRSRIDARWPASRGSPQARDRSRGHPQASGHGIAPQMDRWRDEKAFGMATSAKARRRCGAPGDAVEVVRDVAGIGLGRPAGAVRLRIGRRRRGRRRRHRPPPGDRLWPLGPQHPPRRGRHRISPILTTPPVINGPPTISTSSATARRRSSWGRRRRWPIAWSSSGTRRVPTSWRMSPRRSPTVTPIVSAPTSSSPRSGSVASGARRGSRPAARVTTGSRASAR